MAATLPATTWTGEKIGFLTRALSLIVDTILLGIVNGILTGVLLEGDFARGQGLGTILGLAYYVYFWSSAGGGQTLGMKALGIKVVKTDGSPLSVTGAIIRYVGLIIAFVCLFIGRMPKGMRDLGVYCLRYQQQTYGLQSFESHRIVHFRLIGSVSGQELPGKHDCLFASHDLICPATSRRFNALR